MALQKKDFNFPTLIDLSGYRAEVSPQTTGYSYVSDGVTVEREITYGELHQKAAAIASSLQEKGGAGERALLIFPSDIDFICAFFGCLYSGIIAVPAYPPGIQGGVINRELKRLFSIMSDAKPTFILTTSFIFKAVTEKFPDLSTLPGVTWIATDTIDPGMSAQWKRPTINPDTIAFLQYTSGSTAMPKGVVLNHGNLMHNESMIYDSYEHSDDTIVFGWLPLFHDMGLIGNIVQPLYGGFPCIFMSPISFLQKPLRWLMGVTGFRATTSIGPNFAYDLCVRKISDDERKGLDLRSWKKATNAAEPINPVAMENFIRTYEPYGFDPRTMFPNYGLAEATLFVMGGKKNEKPVVKSFDADMLEKNIAREVVENGGEATADSVRTLVGCGSNYSDQEILIVDPESRTVCPDGRIGEFWIAGKSVTRGYWNKPELTEEIFGARLAGSDRGPYLRTGDLGFVLADDFFITGRLKDLIKIHGANHYPQDIEYTAEQSSPEIRRGCGAAFSVLEKDTEQLVVVYEIKQPLSDRDRIAVFENINSGIFMNHGLNPHAIVLIEKGTMNKTTSGKIQRNACKEAFSKSKLSVIHQWNRVETREKPVPAAKTGGAPLNADTLVSWLVERIARESGLRENDIDVDSPFANFNLNSVKVVAIASDLRDRLGVEVPPTLMFEFPTIRDLAEHLTGRIISN